MGTPQHTAEAADDRLRALMRGYQDGQLDAFEGLYASLEDELRRFFRARCFDSQRVEDLLQETFLQVHRSRRSYRPDLPVRPWVYAIAKRVFFMHVRKVKRREAPEVALTGAAELTATATGDVLSRVVVDDALRNLPADARHAFLLHHRVGLSFREIADRLGLAPAAAKLRSSRAARLLRHLLSEPSGGHRD